MHRKPATSLKISRILKIGLILVIPIVFIFGIYNLVAHLGLPKQRMTVLFLTNPIEVVSFDPIGQSFTLIRFPVEVHLSGIYGLGNYSAESLWGVAKTQGKAESVLLGSVTDELGVPVEYYLGNKGSDFINVKDGQKAIVQFFSWGAIWSAIIGGFQTNVPLSSYVALVKAWQNAPFENIQDITLTRDRGLLPKALADGSTVYEINRAQLDAITDDLFEDQQVRTERLRISIYNTTNRAFLGSRVGRILSKRGMNVIEVGNVSPKIDACEITGQKEDLETTTAKIIIELFKCQTLQNEEPDKADLRVKIGYSYEKLFIPPEDISNDP